MHGKPWLFSGPVLAAILLASAMAIGEEAPDEGFPLLVGTPEGKAWAEARVKAAKANKRELVRIPIAGQSAGWGCVCPYNFMGTDPNGNSGGAWLEVTWSDLAPAPEGGRSGYAVVAEGYFTGATSEEVWEEGDERYRLLGFQVLRHRPAKAYDERDMTLAVVLDAAEAARPVPPFADDRPWIVVAASVALSDPRSEKRAEALGARLRKAGIEGAEVFDSRRAPLLFAGYRIVAAGRYKTREEAVAASTVAARKGRISPTVRKGW